MRHLIIGLNNKDMQQEEIQCTELMKLVKSNEKFYIDFKDYLRVKYNHWNKKDADNKMIWFCSQPEQTQLGYLLEFVNSNMYDVSKDLIEDFLNNKILLRIPYDKDRMK